MIAFFVFLLLAIFIALLVGLVNPSLVLRWSKKPTRLKVFGWWCLASIVMSLFIAIAAPDTPSEKTTKSTAESAEQTIDSTAIRQNDSLKLAIKQQIDIGKKKFNTQYDDIEGITWIYSKSKPYYSNTMGFYTYLGVKDNGYAWKRLVIRYHGNDWLFLQKITIKADNQTFTLDASNAKRDNNADVWEWIDISVAYTEDIIIDQIIRSKQIKVRFVGNQYHRDWNLSQKEIRGLKEIEEYYQLLNSYYQFNNE
jgi:hypothetical protein